jgi:hypothetical protein
MRNREAEKKRDVNAYDVQRLGIIEQKGIWKTPNSRAFWRAMMMHSTERGR